jgi:hypothetical protein
LGQPNPRSTFLLAEALGKAATAGRWSVVARLARELEARRSTRWAEVRAALLDVLGLA